MKIGQEIKFKYNEKIYTGKYLESQLAMFPDYTEANQNQIKLEITDSETRKALNMGRKKTITIDENFIVNEKKSIKNIKKRKIN